MENAKFKIQNAKLQFKIQKLSEMPKKLTDEEIGYVASLARIGLKKQEKTRFGKQLSSILEYVEQLNSLETDKVLPLAQTTNLTNIYRKDSPNKAQILSQEEVLQNAPAKKNGHIKVKKILE